ncbi:MAG: OmpA family protein, partial [Paracoccaceae bacterium]|nr:OmpA family protein [Paracoccaceae bacterium]
GLAPDENQRFRALSAAGTVVEASRVIDMFDVAPGIDVAPPRFSIEILRNLDGIRLIGLIPTKMDRETVVSAISDLANGADVADLLETADYPVPDGWGNAVSFGLEALASLPRSQISISAERVGIKAISDSPKEKQALEAMLLKTAPDDIILALDISAPRPVVSPYTLRFVKDKGGARFDACTTDTPSGREKILSAARIVGLEGGSSCTIGLGIPSPDWDDAVVMGIMSLGELGGGSISFSDADVTLVALEATPQTLFDSVVGELADGLPEVFSLHSILPEPQLDENNGEEQVIEFAASLTPDGQLQLRGVVTSERTRQAARSLAFARFGVESVSGSMRLREKLPVGWTERVLTGIDALSRLDHGSVVVRPEIIRVSGSSGDANTKADLARFLSGNLPDKANYEINVSYVEELSPDFGKPTPQDCVESINKVLGDNKITFAPSSAEIDSEARETIDRIADLMKDCTEVRMEVGGHTDSQGRETMNLGLSQGRAEAVVNALLARRILTSNLTAKGYGETKPIADNETEEGREANRRIEFRLIMPDEVEPTAEDVSGESADATDREPNDDGFDSSLEEPHPDDMEIMDDISLEDEPVTDSEEGAAE